MGAKKAAILALCVFSAVFPCEACSNLDSLAHLSYTFGFPTREFIDRLSCVNSEGGELSVGLFGKGSHRELQLKFEFRTDGAMGGKGAWDECIFLLHLPPTLFVDPYQLEDLSTKRKFPPNFKVYGEVDLESPAPASSPTLVWVLIPLLKTNTISLPIHAKYPKPKSIIGGVEDAFEIVNLPPPLLVFKHSNGSFQLLDQHWKSLQWRIPAGDMSHLRLVNFVTVGVLLVSMAMVVWALCAMEFKKQK
ncbi:hypothetical protein BSKO_07088 [Bryopsis sp. KO-2023]|nr:hypothetical protein BSKO_07088 [Bryopsis sp. KO-2023]